MQWQCVAVIPAVETQMLSGSRFSGSVGLACLSVMTCQVINEFSRCSNCYPRGDSLIEASVLSFLGLLLRGVETGLDGFWNKRFTKLSIGPSSTFLGSVGINKTGERVFFSHILGEWRRSGGECGLLVHNVVGKSRQSKFVKIFNEGSNTVIVQVKVIK